MRARAPRSPKASSTRRRQRELLRPHGQVGDGWAVRAARNDPAHVISLLVAAAVGRAVARPMKQEHRFNALRALGLKIAER